MTEKQVAVITGMKTHRQHYSAMHEKPNRLQGCWAWSKVVYHLDAGRTPLPPDIHFMSPLCYISILCLMASLCAPNSTTLKLETPGDDNGAFSCHGCSYSISLRKCWKMFVCCAPNWPKHLLINPLMLVCVCHLVSWLTGIQAFLPAALSSSSTTLSLCLCPQIGIFRLP